MASKQINGYDGHVDWATLIDSDVAYNTHSWTLDLVADQADVTDFSADGFREFKSGLKGWSGSVELYTDDTQKLQVSIVSSSATIRLHFDNKTTFTGTAVCTGWHPAVSVDGITTQTVDFQGDGALTVA